MASNIEVITEAQGVVRKSQIVCDEPDQKEKRKSPFKSWTQQNNDNEAREARFWLMKKSSDAYCIMDFLASNMDRYNAVICSYKVIQEKLGLSQATVARAIKILKEHKYVEVKKSGTSNVYLINKTLYWNSWGTNYAYAEFGAKVILAASEQDKETQEEIKIQIKKRQEVELREREEKNTAEDSDAK